MKTSAIILAGAVAFDLGVLVVAGQAAEAPKAPKAPAAATAPVAPGVALNFEKIKVDYIYIKVDLLNTVKSCEHKHGKVVEVEGVAMCRLPNKAAPKPDGR